MADNSAAIETRRFMDPPWSLAGTGKRSREGGSGHGRAVPVSWGAAGAAVECGGCTRWIRYSRAWKAFQERRWGVPERHLWVRGVTRRTVSDYRREAKGAEKGNGKLACDGERAANVM